MDIQEYIDEIKLQLTGGVLELEIDDPVIMKIINASFREIQRYIDLTVIETMDYSNCINLNPRKVNSVVKVYRTIALASSSNSTSSSDTSTTNYGDPMYISQWQLLGGNNYALNNISNYVYNYTAYATMQQIRNTLSTDLAFRYDRATNNLYINISQGLPTQITVEYIPRFDDVSEIYSDYWIDMIMKMSVALTKITLGRIRSRFKQSGALWEQDGDAILAEGKEELTAIRDELKQSTRLFYPID